MTSTPFHLEPIYTDQYVVTGDVVIAAGVMIAPGVLLQADPGSRIILGSGVCLGMGCVVHANAGEVRVEAGANLGAGVLLVGAVKIGPGAIVGAGTTIFEQSIVAGEIVPPNSLRVLETNVAATATDPVPAPSVEHQPQPLTEPAKVNVDGNGFFYGKGNRTVNVIDDPWASDTPVATQPAAPTADATVNASSAFTTTPPVPPLSTVTPVVSTFVDPGDNCQPKHAWQTSADAVLNNAIAVDAVEAATATQPSIDAPHPDPDSDLSQAEMQDGLSGAIPTTLADANALVPQPPKQVYGQAYVNQMLGKMMGKRS
jgi:carbonic anhydrase/acetyltransferase-like protein (isoleucine patch superfamily)